MQKTGESTRDLWHKTDWAKVRDDPESIGFPREDWIHQFDAEKFAEENFDQVLSSLRDPVAEKPAEAFLGAAVTQTAVVS